MRVFSLYGCILWLSNVISGQVKNFNVSHMHADITAALAVKRGATEEDKGTRAAHARVAT